MKSLFVFSVAAVSLLAVQIPIVSAQGIVAKQVSLVKLVDHQDAIGCDSCDSICRDVRCSRPSLYASFNLRGSFDNLQSGGFNTIGVFPNTGSDNSDTISLGGVIGTVISRNRGKLRLECEGLYVDPFNVVTNSFAPPTPTFFYRTNFSNRWAVLGNSWFDMSVTDCMDFYAGGGVGGGGATLSVNDLVVEGSGSSSDVVWQVGCGLVRNFDRASVDLGYRYMDWGTMAVPLTALGGGPSAGDFTADVTSHQIFLGIRYNGLGDLFLR